jgi:hypothetical protein
MKKHYLVALAISFTLFATSCIKSKDWTCNCTYIHHTDPFDSIPKGNINESSVVKGRFTEQAQTECSFLENKYFRDNFTGTCLLQ